jgi:hypothetical protein
MSWISMMAGGGDSGGRSGGKGSGGGGGGARRRGDSGFDWRAWQSEAEAELAALGCTGEQMRREIAHKRERVAARLAWLDERVAALIAAEEAAKAAWLRLIGAVERLELDGRGGPVLPAPPEQEEFDSILAQLRAAAEGRWPRHLHFESERDRLHRR